MLFRSNKYTCTNEIELRNNVCELLDSYYECKSDYGNPVYDLVCHMNVLELCMCIEKYNYKIEFDNNGSTQISDFFMQHN